MMPKHALGEPYRQAPGPVALEPVALEPVALEPVARDPLALVVDAK
ncbi:MAG: hypothetical protein NT168_12795 [Planctomycetota bacterium]|nr:hypothetical protein [Planctomycetota bacterium]